MQQIWPRLVPAGAEPPWLHRWKKGTVTKWRWGQRAHNRWRNDGCARRKRWFIIKTGPLNNDPSPSQGWHRDARLLWNSWWLETAFVPCYSCILHLKCYDSLGFFHWVTRLSSHVSSERVWFATALSFTFMMHHITFFSPFLQWDLEAWMDGWRKHETHIEAERKGRAWDRQTGSSGLLYVSIVTHPYTALPASLHVHCRFSLTLRHWLFVFLT